MKRIFIISAISVLLLSACVRMEPAPDEVNRQEITFDTPVASTMMKSVPGPITDASYPADETMGIFAVHSKDPAGSWGTGKMTDYIPGAEFKSLSDGLWAGWDGENQVRHPYYWPNEGSLIFAGYSPYWKMKAHDEHVSVINGEDSDLVKVENVSFDAENRTLSIEDYHVGEYVPMTKKQLEEDDYHYENVHQSDLMIFMPDLDKDGNYIGYKDQPFYAPHFKHALSLVEFNVKVEHEHDVNMVGIYRIEVENVIHKGNLVATLLDNGEVDIKWTPDDDAEHISPITVFNPNLSDPSEEHKGFHPTTTQRTIAQLLIIPGPTHTITLETHVHINGHPHEQELLFEPEDIGISQWLPGRRYVYNIVLGVENIKFSSTVSEWGKINGPITVQ